MGLAVLFLKWFLIGVAKTHLYVEEKLLRRRQLA